MVGKLELNSTHNFLFNFKICGNCWDGTQDLLNIRQNLPQVMISIKSFTPQRLIYSSIAEYAGFVGENLVSGKMFL
jgi:hypothetical protein